MTTVWKTKTGFPSRYALCCGHIRTETTADNVQVTYWQECPEIPAIHVRAYDHNIGRRIFWHTYQTQREAQRVYLRALRGFYPIVIS